MKAYVTSIGERTTALCCEQLERFGFGVVLMQSDENWPHKYARFIHEADENCLRVDADVIVNKNIATVQFNGLMKQWHTYDFYRNDIGVTSPVYYSKLALGFIRNRITKIDWTRPEATAWRLPDINGLTETGPEVVGIHGFFQDDEHLKRHLENKIERKQIEEYDFELARKMKALYEKN